MPTRIELLKQAGFTDAEIGDWATGERRRMQEAGFTDGEIDEEFGVTRPPKEVPAAFIERLKQGNWLHRVLGAAGEYAQHYFGDEPLGFSPENTAALRKLGVVGDIVVPAAKPIDAVLRSVPAGIAGLGAGLGQMVEEGHDAALGPGPYAKGKAARDFAQLAQIAALVSGASGPKTGAIRAPTANVANGPVIALPRAEDFRNAAAVISGTPASFRTEQTLLRLWTDHGIPPAELAADAVRDPTVGEVIKSDSDRLPASVEAADRSLANPNTSESARMIARSGDRNSSLTEPPQKRQRPFTEDYPRYQTDARGRLLRDIEGRPLEAQLVAGRRFSGKADVRLSPDDIENALAQLNIPLKYVDPGVLQDRIGGLYMHRSPTAPFGEISINTRYKSSDQNIFTAHEFGHAIDDLAATELSSTLTPDEIFELRDVYNDLRGGSKKGTPWRQPEDTYSWDSVKSELIAEGLRAYMTNPNYFKTVAPKAAATFRAAVNESPYLKKVIQLNSLGAIGLIGAGGRSEDRDDQ